MEAVSAPNPQLMLLPANPSLTTSTVSNADMATVDPSAPVLNEGAAAAGLDDIPDVAATLLVPTIITDITKTIHQTSNTITPAAIPGTDTDVDIATTGTNTIGSTTTNKAVASADEVTRQSNNHINIQVAVQDISCPICQDIFTSAYVSVSPIQVILSSLLIGQK
jgi:hypothetical protein